MQACAPFVSVIELDGEVTKVEAARRIKIAVLSPCASKVTVPEFASVPLAVEYVPAWMVRPAKSLEESDVAVGTLKSLYATTKST